MIEKILDKLPLYKLPMKFKLFWGKCFIRMFSLDNLDNDILLYNDLREWIETKGRPTTSSPNYFINKGKP